MVLGQNYEHQSMNHTYNNCYYLDSPWNIYQVQCLIFDLRILGAFYHNKWYTDNIRFKINGYTKLSVILEVSWFFVVFIHKKLW